MRQFAEWHAPQQNLIHVMGLVVQLVSDLTYTWIDPRIDFENREV